MDSVGAFLDQEWESLNKMFSIEDSDSLFPSYQNVPGVEDTNFYSTISPESGESSETNTALFTYQPTDINFPQDVTSQNTFEFIDYYPMHCSSINDSSTVPVFTDEVMEELLQLNAHLCTDQLNSAEVYPTKTDDSCKKKGQKRKYETPEAHTRDDQLEEKSSSESPKKKSRAPRNAHQNKRNVQSRKKKPDEVGNNEEESIRCGNDCNASNEEPFEGSNSDSPNTNGKPRSGRGSSSNAQSLYARRRREKISERLRILQNLVPNGTKVDLTTMLEEAVHYVKFLQLQIKLLSSDDMWMYSPIAYNGMDMGLYQKMILPNLWLQN